MKKQNVIDLNKVTETLNENHKSEGMIPAFGVSRERFTAIGELVLQAVKAEYNRDDTKVYKSGMLSNLFDLCETDGLNDAEKMCAIMFFFEEYDKINLHAQMIWARENEPEKYKAALARTMMKMLSNDLSE